MSDHFLVVLPFDPQASAPASTQPLRDALAKMAGTNEVRFKDFGKLQFIDCGENFERILCPACDTELATEWWGQQMDHSWDNETGFDLHAHALPCCGSPMALDRLNYKPMQGFASWFVSARNPGRGPLTKAEVTQLEAVAGLKLRAISQAY